MSWDITSPPWWGEFNLNEGETAYWRVGPLMLWIRRTEEGVAVAHHRGDDALDSMVGVDLPPLGHLPPDDIGWDRFSFAQMGSKITLIPRLADRPVLSRPEGRVFVPAGERITLYITSPVWVEIRAEGRFLLEIPTWRPSDTWLGSPVDGALCYASRTSCRRNLETVPVRPHRAITPILLNNLASAPLLLERISIPVSNLNLYAAEDQRFWTTGLELVREEDGAFAKVRLEEGPPQAQGNFKEVGQARLSLGSSFMSRTFGSLFGLGRGGNHG